MSIFLLAHCPQSRINATPHRTMAAHEIDAMAAIARADVDGFSVREQGCGSDRSGNASCGRRWRGCDVGRLFGRRW